MSQSNWNLSERSSSHSIVLSKTAEACAAQVRVQFVHRKTVLRTERTSVVLRQADIDEELEILQQNKEAAALTAKYGGIRVFPS